MAPLSRRERAGLCDLMDTVGPDAPTLCGDWTTYDLAAHLVVRERRPAAAPGILLPPLAGLTERGMDRLKESHEYPALVQLLRSGPPGWSPMRLDAVDQVANTVEFFVHHEDVRRAAPPWEPRLLEPRDERALWAGVRRMARVLVRRSTVGIHLVRDGDRDPLRAKEGRHTLRVEGRPGELLLFVYGRSDVADVTLGGDDAARELFDAGRLGL